MQDCGFAQSPGVLSAANLRYYGKLEVWLENAAHSLLVGFYDIAIELPLNAQAVAGADLPITVTLNTNLVTVNTPVTGLGLLKSYLMLCPGQDVPQQLTGGNVIGNLTDASGVTDVYVGETYCMQHVRCPRADCGGGGGGGGGADPPAALSNRSSRSSPPTSPSWPRPCTATGRRSRPCLVRAPRSCGVAGRR